MVLGGLKEAETARSETGKYGGYLYPTEGSSMYIEPYNECRSCGADLEEPTTYRNHAYCSDCEIGV